MLVNTDRANEARALANAAQELLPGAGREFPLGEQFQGRELEIVEGANNILRREGDAHISLTVPRAGYVAIQA